LNAHNPQPSLLPIAHQSRAIGKSGIAAMAAIKSLFALLAVAAVSIGLLLPVPGAHRDVNVRGQFEIMDVAN
jgi:hypothetical protein